MRLIDTRQAGYSITIYFAPETGLHACVAEPCRELVTGLFGRDLCDPMPDGKALWAETELSERQAVEAAKAWAEALRMPVAQTFSILLGQFSEE